MRRILIFSLVYYPNHIGGAEVAIKEITGRIPPSEIEFDMVTLRLDSRLPKFERIGNVNIYRVGWAGKQRTSSDSLPWYLHLNKYAMLWSAFRKASALHRERKYDATWSLMATYNSFAALFFKLTHLKVPFLFTLQDGDPIPYLKRRALPLYPLFKMIFTRADHIQCISNYLADWAKEMGVKCPVSVVPNGVNYRLFSERVPESRLGALQGQIGRKDGDIFLITASRLVVKNAVGDIIEALKYLPTNVKLLVLGTGYEEKRLRELAREIEAVGVGENGTLFLKNHGLPRGEREREVGRMVFQKQSSILSDATQRVQFLGHISHDELPAYLQASDIFIRPSLSEGFGNSFIEAMAAGIPVIATPVGGIVDFLKDGETGLFCEVKNPKSIAQKVEKLIKDKESREHIVRNARKMVEEKYDWGNVAGDMKAILQTL